MSEENRSQRSKSVESREAAAFRANLVGDFLNSNDQPDASPIRGSEMHNGRPQVPIQNEAPTGFEEQQMNNIKSISPFEHIRTMQLNKIRINNAFDWDVAKYE